ncbi:unnamed protein product [Ilex paraguariensis]|uniref:ADP-ribosylation factor-like protein 8A n=1 Tax=Ilex paraguariensis TaxID=185542 RepID=A0ABC8TZT0_9AQUA
MGLWEAFLNWLRRDHTNLVFSLRLHYPKEKKDKQGSVQIIGFQFNRFDSSLNWLISSVFRKANVSRFAFNNPDIDAGFVALVSFAYVILSSLIHPGASSYIRSKAGFKSLFFKQEMELSLIGLQNAGKTSLVNVVATGGYSEDMIPTVGFNMRKVTKGNVTIKLWDLGGQPRFRSMWERYCRAVSAIVYVVDAADHDNLSISRSELHDLLSKPSLSGIPLLVLGNKIDKPGALSKDALTDQMGLKSITDREVCCFMISCKNSTNIDSVIDWLVKHSKSKS